MEHLNDGGETVWVRRFFTCNPFYLVSAVLILVGMYLVIVDEKFFTEDLEQVIFNFTSIQVYEVCLVAAAIFLAKYKVWYDSLLLLVIEFVFLLIPFVLLSGALFLGQYELSDGVVRSTPHWNVILALVVIMLGLLAGRYVALRQAYKGLDLGGATVIRAMPTFMANLALPFLFRFAFDHGTSEAAIGRNSLLTWAFYVVAPIIALLPNLRFSAPKQWPKELHRQPWLQFFAMTVLAIMTLFHLIWMKYVYDLELKAIHFLPVIWAFSWTFWNRVRDYCETHTAILRYWLLFLPALITPVLLVRAHWGVVAVPVTVNGVIYGLLHLRKRYVPVAGRLAILSVLSVFLTLPHDLFAKAPTESMADSTLTTLLVIGVIVALVIHNPFGAVLAAICSSRLAFLHMPGDFVQWIPAISIGLGAFLLHSCLWRRDDAERMIRLYSVIVMICFGFWLNGGGWYNLTIHMGVIGTVLIVWWWLAVAYDRDDMRMALRTLHLGPLAIVSKGILRLIRDGALGPVVILGAFSIFAIGVWLSYRKRLSPTVVDGSAHDAHTRLDTEGRP